MLLALLANCGTKVFELTFWLRWQCRPKHLCLIEQHHAELLTEILNYSSTAKLLIYCDAKSLNSEAKDVTKKKRKKG